MIGDPQLKKYAGKSPEWCYRNALAALAGAGHLLDVAFIRSLGIRSGRLYVKGISAVLVLRRDYFSVPIYTFDPDESAALRAQAIYWGTIRGIGGTGASSMRKITR